MKTDVVNAILAPFLFVVLAATHVPGGEPARRSIPENAVGGERLPSSRRAEHDPPGENSPEALIVKFLMSIAEGNPAATVSCFDQSTTAGKREAMGWQSLAKANAAYREARRAAARKFGKAGAAVIDEEYKIGFLAEYLDPAKMQKLIDKNISVEREGDDEAAARPFGDDIPMHRKDGRWYVTPVGDPSDPVALPLAVVSTIWIEAFERVRKLVEQSESPEQLRQITRRAVDAASGRMMQNLEASFGDPDRKEQGRGKGSGSQSNR